VTGVRGYGALVLFEARVRAAAPRFELAEADLPLVIDLCRQLDGLPLAIELAAARVPLVGLRAVHARLRERFLLLTAGTRSALRRHQTLRAAMDWSHALLSDAQRAAFRRLGVFSGGFTMELAQAVCADKDHDEWAVLEQLAALVDKSLVVADTSEPVRYRLLESPRAFALEQLAAAGETAAMLERHAAAMLQFLRGADDGNMDSTLRSEEYAALVLPELDNLRAAYAWATGEGGDRPVAIGLAAHAGPLIDYSNEFAEWLLAQQPQLDPSGVDEATEARFWRAMAATNMQGQRIIAELLRPFIPGTAERTLTMLGVPANPDSWKDLKRGDLRAGTALGATAALFPRIEHTVEELREMSSDQAPGTPAPGTAPGTAPSSAASASAPANTSEVRQDKPVSRITIDDFMKVELRVAKVLAAERVPKSKKLLKLSVDVGTEQLLGGELGLRQVRRRAEADEDAVLAPLECLVEVFARDELDRVRQRA